MAFFKILKGASHVKWLSLSETAPRSVIIYCPNQTELHRQPHWLCFITDHVVHVNQMRLQKYEITLRFSWSVESEADSHRVHVAQVLKLTLIAIEWEWSQCV